MDGIAPRPRTPLEEAKAAFAADDAEALRAVLDRHPALKATIDEPVGPFDSPAIVNVRSRAMLDVLIDAGADINGRSRWWAGGFGLLHLADPGLSAYAIERGAIVDAHAASRLGMIDRLRALIERDPDLVHARGGDGMTPLHFAATVEIAADLLDRGAEIDARDVDHESTPAQYMVSERQEVNRYLISRGCRTDLLMASALGDMDLVRSHLDRDPESIRTRVNGDWFPMVNDKAGGTIYQWMLGFNLSAQQVARKFGHDHLLPLLLERRGADVALIDACWSGDEPVVRSIRSTQPDIAARLTDADRRQVAHAARENASSAVRLMLECGWPVDATGQHGATPLHWAAFHGNAGMCEAILRLGPPLERTDADFKSTPLGWAIHGSEHGWHCRTGDYAATVEALLRAGAKPPAAIEGRGDVQEALRRWTGTD